MPMNVVKTAVPVGRVRGAALAAILTAVFLSPLVLPTFAAEDLLVNSFQTLRAKVGVYYFDGWSGKSDKYHLPEHMKIGYVDRKPVWGWYDNTAEIMRQQIDLCADHGVSFWAFDWYYFTTQDAQKQNKPNEAINAALNQALELYLKAPNARRLDFCLLVATTPGPAVWEACCSKWLALFQQPGYLRVDGKPLLIIFSPPELKTACGGTDAVYKKLNGVRELARQAGLPGVMIAACAGPWERLA